VKEDRGSVSAFLACLGVGLFVVVGLVVDGGRALAARRSVIDVAEEAARTGADQLSVDALRRGVYVVDPVSAAQAVEDALLAAGVEGTASVSGDTVTVSVRTAVPTTILGIVGLKAISVSGAATATNLHGIATADG
jgi:Flp pilus assembly protein TadG